MNEEMKGDQIGRVLQLYFKPFAEVKDKKTPFDLIVGLIRK